MKRTMGALVLLAVVGGCVDTNPSPYMGDVWKSGAQPAPTYRGAAGMPGACTPGGSTGLTCGAWAPPSIPGVQGPWGQPVPMAAPYAFSPPATEGAARAMMAQSVPLNQVQLAGYNPTGGLSGGIVQAGGYPAGGYPAVGMPPGAIPPPGGMSPPGVPLLPGGPALPSAPGMPLPAGLPRSPGVVAAVGALTGGPPHGFAASRTEVFFTGPPGMRISWYAPTGNGQAAFSPEYIEAPGRYNFLQAAIYRLKLSDIPNHQTVDLYPTLEVVPCNPKTAAFLAHSSVPVTFTDEDFEQVFSGNYVVKVIYLPDPQFQDLATTGPAEVVLSHLDPGVDPICEAQRRGSILLVIRMGNIDLSLPHSPGMDAPNPYQPQHAAPPLMPGAPGMPGIPGPMGPGLGMGPNMPPAGAGGPSGGGPAMGPGGPGMGPNGPSGLVPAPQPSAPGVPPASRPALSPGTPLTRTPETSPLEPVRFQKPAPPLPPPSPAALASQSPAGPALPPTPVPQESSDVPGVIPK